MVTFLPLTYIDVSFLSIILRIHGRHGVFGLASLLLCGSSPGSLHKGRSLLSPHILHLTSPSIPEFNDLLALVSSLFASWFTYGISGTLWLFVNWGRWTGTKTKMLLTIVNLILLTIGSAVCFLGLYASGYAIHSHNGQGGSWSCFSSPSG
jgi:hypothetical protein